MGLLLLCTILRWLFLSAWLGVSLHLHPHIELPLQSQFTELGKHRGPCPHWAMTIVSFHVPQSLTPASHVEGDGAYRERSYRTC